MYDITEKVLAKFDENVSAALRVLLQREYFPVLDSVGSNINIVTDETWAFKRTLTLKNVNNAPIDKEDYLCVNLSIGFKEAENRFCLLGELEHPIDDTAELFALSFESAEVDVDIYNACNHQFFWDNPWAYLKGICTSINIKSEIPHNYCNNKEKALLPIIREIDKLNFWFEVSEENPYSFSELKKLAVMYGYNKIEKMLSKLETLKPDDSKCFKLFNKAINTLCKKQYEPLWRDIYGRIANSQMEYPDEVESLCDKELLVGIRNDIQKLMESKGYIGEYPDFVKDSVLRGIHLVRSYDMAYWVGMGEKSQCHIHCFESLEENYYLTIQFLCGTALLKKDEIEQGTDIYGCLFNDNGRRLFSTVHHYIPLKDEFATKADDLETSVTIAVKRAECIKLNKAEKREFHGRIIPGFELFFAVFMLAGCLFALAMTLALAIICTVITAAFGLFNSIPEMFLSIPWWLILVLGWIGFGIPMGIVEVLSRRR